MKSRFNIRGIWLALIIVLSLGIIIGAFTACSADESTPPIMDQSTEPSAPSDSSPSLSTPSSPNSVLPSDSTFSVHFIDVGQADAALVLCDGHAMLIDGGNVEDSNLIYTYLKKQEINHLDYIVNTHAHEDHVGGLAGALNYATVNVAYCPVENYDSKAFSNFTKYLDKQNVSITVPKAGDTFSLGSATATIIGPIKPSDEPNNTSIVLRIVYGDTSFLFTGDAEREEEQNILDAGYELTSTVLKVGHHGSSSSTTYPFLREVAPQYAVISVGIDNTYGHPGEDTLSRLRDADVKVYRTDMQGDIVCTSDGKTVTFTTAKGSDAKTLAEIGNNSLQAAESAAPAAQSPVTTDYIANTNTGKFHYPSCSSVDQMNESNKLYFTGSRDELIELRYVPCKKCNP